MVSPHCLAASGGKGYPEADWVECARGVPSGAQDMKVFRMLAQATQLGAEINATARADRDAAERKRRTVKPRK